MHQWIGSVSRLLAAVVEEEEIDHEIWSALLRPPLPRIGSKTGCGENGNGRNGRRDDG
jgi:hypothetical protein